VFTLWTLTPMLYFGAIGGLLFIFSFAGLGTIVIFFKGFGTKFIKGILKAVLPRVYHLKYLKSVRKKFKTYDELHKKANQIVNEFFTNVDQMANTPRILFTGIFLAYISYLFVILQLHFVLLAFGIKLPFLIVLSLVVLPELMGLISSTPGGFGILEASMVLLFESAIGITAATATAIMLTTRLISYWLTIFIGFFCVTFLWHRILGTSKKELWNAS